MFLVNYNYDYADEFDVDGFEILTQEEVDEIKQAIATAKYPKEQYFGTNEALLFENADDVNRGMMIREISDQEAEVLKKFFGTGFGTIPYFTDWLCDV